MSTTTTVPAPAPITYPCVLTDELYEQWLDAHPGRRESYQHDPDQRAAVARAYAIRGTGFAVALVEGDRLARQLLAHVERTLGLYGPREAERILVAAGLRVPDDNDRNTHFGADTFKDAHGYCRRVARRLREFIAEGGFGVGGLVRLLDPANDPVPSREAAEGGA